jgi:hypothetical protein
VTPSGGFGSDIARLRRIRLRHRRTAAEPVTVPGAASPGQGRAPRRRGSAHGRRALFAQSLRIEGGRLRCVRPRLLEPAPTCASPEGPAPTRSSRLLLRLEGAG